MQGTRTIVCEGCDQAASVVRELEIHVVDELYVDVRLCDGCLKRVGHGRVDPLFFFGHLVVVDEEHV